MFIIFRVKWEWQEHEEHKESEVFLVLQDPLDKLELKECL